ncbi:MAG: polysaccharide deacetylase [Sphingomonas bacterium]|uniref:polysaccharide deacetylase n=1 Tax=Sphingomonas bacterium TaxID=1895847 RepID=UPI00260904A6|nr:polysaccharide deacetylase [Sphingomonas bacterium]MDB5705812.1 polysaccharide deacetylase [Sphingomonas bacterium]
MTTPVFLTVDTELMWRHHIDGLDRAAIYDRSMEPAGVGISYQLDTLARHGLKGCFFVDPMPALLFGLEPTRRVVGTILDAGQEVQLHLHPNWTGAKLGDGGARYGRFEMMDYSLDEQRDLIAGATDLLMAAGAARPIAFRAGSYSANDDTLRALSALGFAYDSSHNGAEQPWPSAIGLPTTHIAPVPREGLIEVPVTLIEDRPGPLRNFQICALSAGEMRAALEHAVIENHAAVTIVSHGFELANRSGTRANAVHVRRFDALCTLLGEWAEILPTVHFADRPELRIGQADAPLGPNSLRTRWRQAEQLWSNMVEERAA